MEVRSDDGPRDERSGSPIETGTQNRSEKSAVLYGGYLNSPCVNGQLCLPNFRTRRGRSLLTAVKSDNLRFTRLRPSILKHIELRRP
jgi:hypothetical protein